MEEIKNESDGIVFLIENLVRLDRAVQVGDRDLVVSCNALYDARARGLRESLEIDISPYNKIRDKINNGDIGSDEI